MVLTMAQTTTFFEHAEQMGIPHTTVVQLRSEGIDVVADLVDLSGFITTVGGHFETSRWMRTRPQCRGPSWSHYSSQKRIAVACDLVRF